MKCPKCGAENPEDHKFCSQCGSTIEQKRRCSCGAELPEEALFCPECGKKIINFSKGMENGHEWVDLGLSVKWATCNVGANQPEDYGDYFAWGELYDKASYTKDNYAYQYNPVELPLNADAAHNHWGGRWRMPTDDELTELREKCHWELLCTQNGLKGCRIIGQNGNSIFLPAQGQRSGKLIYYALTSGSYWSSSLDTNFLPDTDNACCLDFSLADENGSWGSISRWGGHPIRPVCSLC